MTGENQHEMYDRIYGVEHSEKAYGWIQWKGTNVCIDIHCACGHAGHVDTDFFYAYECPQCHAKYAVAQVIRLIPLETPEKQAFFSDYQTDDA